jgi:hypothetical protein
MNDPLAAAVRALEAEAAKLEARAAEARRIVAALRTHEGAEPAPAKKAPEKKRAPDPAEAKRLKSRLAMRKRRAALKAAAAAPPKAPTPVPEREPPPTGWTYDENGNLTREHTAPPDPSPLIGKKVDTVRRRGNADAGAAQ